MHELKYNYYAPAQQVQQALVQVSKTTTQLTIFFEC